MEGGSSFQPSWILGEDSGWKHCGVPKASSVPWRRQGPVATWNHPCGLVALLTHHLPLLKPRDFCLCCTPPGNRRALWGCSLRPTARHAPTPGPNRPHALALLQQLHSTVSQRNSRLCDAHTNAVSAPLAPRESPAGRTVDKEAGVYAQSGRRHIQ